MRFILGLLVSLLLVVPAYAQDITEDLTTVFTPYTSGTNTYITWLDSHCTRTSMVYVMDYTFTNQLVVDEYVKLANAGVRLHIMLDKSEFNAVKSEALLVDQLKQAGIEVIITTSPVKHAIMHLKATVIDECYVENGSWNYTSAADNQVNVLEFNNTPSLARGHEFMQLWDNLYTYATNCCAQQNH